MGYNFNNQRILAKFGMGDIWLGDHESFGKLLKSKMANLIWLNFFNLVSFQVYFSQPNEKIILLQAFGFIAANKLIFWITLVVPVGYFQATTSELYWTGILIRRLFSRNDIFICYSNVIISKQFY